MSVPDQSHINRVRDALWQRSGGASVMVGSGFSRNALGVRPDAGKPLTWCELAREMFNKLYPQSGDRSRSDASTEMSATDGLLRLAQEYEIAFGKSDLHRFLGKLIRNDDFKPGEWHKRLMQLPWRDVFTTNWDTLLERTQPLVADRAYSVVRNMDEIPLANGPRIVKLHGSFPAQFPLIFTEEDYRTYPKKFAPFVNTAQQAMMETVFCLIGFSGDDPNFLQWSGWVRDNLGEAAPKLYLAGWLDLSHHRRRMLEDRNVVPIDLARHPKAGKWPEHLRYHYAMEWILCTLEQGRPYDVTEWPTPTRQQYSQLPNYLHPVETIESTVPKDEPQKLTEIESGDLPDRVRDTFEAWAHNREIYPGWLVVPANKRQVMSWNTQDWEPLILRVLPDFAPVEQLQTIRELVWRHEILLERISSALESAAVKTLDPIDCEARAVDRHEDPKIEWIDVREAWRSIALALVTVARHRFDRGLFDQRIKLLSPFLDDDPYVALRVYHERCLWAVCSMDFKALEGLLEDWRTENCDPAWMIRKAAILVEMGWDDKATELIDHALDTIRQIPADERSVAGPSREGWALYSKERIGNWDMLSRRWAELAPLKCDVSMEMHHVSNAIRNIRDNRKTSTTQTFDLGTQSTSWNIISADSQAAVYSAIRLCEVAGLPPSIDGVIVASGILQSAAEKLSVSDLEMAIRLVLRVSTYDKDDTLGSVLSRTRVAALPVKSVNTLVEICKGVIEYALPRMAEVSVNTRDVFWTERVRVAIEVLSRLALRLSPDSAEVIFDKALEYYRNNQVAREPWLTGPVRNLLKRSWEALPKDRRSCRVLDLVNAPIAGMDNFTVIDRNYPDPGELLHGDDELSSLLRTSDNEVLWQQVISLLIRGLLAGDHARERAARRIAYVALWKQLTESERSDIASALWSEQHITHSVLPDQTRILDWVFLLLPEPEPGLAEQRFRRKWLTNNAPRENAPSPDDILWQVGNALLSLGVHRYPLNLSDDERCFLIRVVDQWSDIPIPSQSFGPMEIQIRQPTRMAIFGLASVLLEINIPESVGEKLYEKVKALNNSGLPAFRLLVGLVKVIPSRFEELVMLLRMGLVSDNTMQAESAAEGLYLWLRTASKTIPRFLPPPDDLIREIGLIIATRRKAALQQALGVAKWVFEEGSDSQKKIIRPLALQGLGYLVEELRYDREHEQDDKLDLPLLRSRSARLAQSMATIGLEHDPAVASWLKLIEEDPLPEVRHVKDPILVSQHEVTIPGE